MATRRARLKKLMLAANMSGMLVFGNQTKPEALHYVANYTLLGERGYCYLPLEGEPILFLSEAWDIGRAAGESGLADVRVLDREPAAQLASVIRAADGSVGMVNRGVVSMRSLAAIESALGKKTVPANSLIEEAAVIKSGYELSLIREAAGWADTAFQRAMELSKVGMKDYELIAELEYGMRSRGSTDNYQMEVIGKNSTGMLLPTGKLVEPDDLLLFEITPSNGSFTYSAQLCRTAYAGEPSALIREKYGLLVEALEQSLKIIRPGVAFGAVARIQNEIIGSAGYGEFCVPPYMRSRGHSFGLGRIELEDASEEAFREGMSLVVHPNQFIPETGYLALGESIIITADGIERLAKSPSRLYLCGEVAQ